LRAPRYRFRAFPLAACCALLVGCAFPGSVPTTVKIGLSAPFEGLYRDMGYEVLNAVRLAVRQRNQAGGVGRRYLVEQVSLNDFNEAGGAAQQAREMAADPGVVGVLGGWAPQTADAAAPLYAQLGLAFVAPDMEPGRLAGEAARLAAGGAPPRVAVVLCSPDATDRALAGAFAEALISQGGLVVDSLTPTGDDWVREISTALGRLPDVVFMAADALTAADWVVALRAAGFEGMLLGGPALGSSLLVDVAGEASEGVLFVSPFPPPIDDPAFVDAYRELSGGPAPGPFASWTYAATNRLLDAMDSAVQMPPPLRAAVQRAWAAREGDPGQTYIYVIQSGNVYTIYRPR
jgi:branched-chain amino acid transport system substrate-binding protein